MLKVILVAANPRFVKTDRANAYYDEIVSFVNSMGAEVTVDQTVPDFNDTLKIGDLYIVHGKQVDRLAKLPSDSIDTPIVILGHPDGVIHPTDLDWQLNGSRGVPPNEHFIFTADQKLAIQAKVDELNRERQPVGVPTPSRQASGHRPSVR